jgi:hypothetical protein
VLLICINADGTIITDGANVVRSKQREAPWLLVAAVLMPDHTSKDRNMMIDAN